MIIHDHIPRRRKPKPNAKQRELAKEWEELQAKWQPKKQVQAKPQTPYAPKVPVGRTTTNIPSVDSGVGNATKGPDKVYTGTKMIGIATLHKSNAVPIFNDQAAKDVANMRR